jgi:hypothetical protein
MKTTCFIGEDPATVIAAANAAMVGKVVHHRCEFQPESYEFFRASAGDLNPDIGSFLVTGQVTGQVYAITVAYD